MAIVRRSRKLKTLEGEALPGINEVPEHTGVSDSAPLEGSETGSQSNESESENRENASVAPRTDSHSLTETTDEKPSGDHEGETGDVNDQGGHDEPDREDSSFRSEPQDRAEGKTVVVRTHPRRGTSYKETRMHREGGVQTSVDDSRSVTSRWSDVSNGIANGNSGEGKAFPFREPAPVLGPLPAFPRLPSMPEIYGRPEPRLDQDNGKPRL
ncbi:MAG: hypothetical protein FWB82_03830, partial [Treponema sp.]|nr:hypothetical protein [Treponema sp.]